ncbi:hypothetical protein [Pseudosporangium ferrugineum]|uniref:Uncharacterized protein n=1 Tax=Pseudosporangium ferrugineum TaxID=439699 RepID=A0A2T0R9B0_9ACTN|nr:hypothetical protein [Pseudosporangium ferrugineum]PRY17745.1 hypothetical protein CLV70_14813 [Pseudosporangium ferrugineum]
MSSQRRKNDGYVLDGMTRPMAPALLEVVGPVPEHARRPIAFA